MKVVLTGGTGQLGNLLRRSLIAAGHEIVVIGRSTPVSWDGRTLGPWARELDGADAVINLAGRSVNCRYTTKNLSRMMNSRVDSTRVVGQAIAAAARPPRVWLQMSTATIYAHRFDAPNDERTGRMGGSEPDVPSYWGFSIDIARAWEQALFQASVPATRRVALRSAMVMSPDAGGIFAVLSRLARARLGGPIAGGGQWVSWIHERDFVRSIEFLLARPDLDGAVNLVSPGALPQRELMAGLREAWNVGLGLPATRWMAELGAFVLRTDTELVLKSRRVAPGRLLEAGFSFDFPGWLDAARDLVTRTRDRRRT